MSWYVYSTTNIVSVIGTSPYRNEQVLIVFPDFNLRRSPNLEEVSVPKLHLLINALAIVFLNQGSRGGFEIQKCLDSASDKSWLKSGITQIIGISGSQQFVVCESSPS